MDVISTTRSGETARAPGGLGFLAIELCAAGLVGLAIGYFIDALAGIQPVLQVIAGLAGLATSVGVLVVFAARRRARILRRESAQRDLSIQKLIASLNPDAKTKAENRDVNVVVRHGLERVGG